MSLQSAYDRLRAHGLALPEAVEEHPWGHSALKVRGKTFVFLNLDPERLSLSAKLPVSRDFALMLDFTEPTGYGLGRSGWVSSAFGPGDAIDLDLLQRWIEESYRAIAPKRLGVLVPDRAEG
ncbi:MAG TPA: MmcQ/YjbR family DNA-binding protein [Allosphingosinicella sp.]|jgi:predicted DNA-binding protein (MmcQ/YjbR family)